MTPEPPGRSEVEAWFVAILDGSRTRAEADTWAATWIRDGSTETTDEVVWWGLGLLHGIDLTDGPGGRLLHDDDQVRRWLAEVVARFGEGCRDAQVGGEPGRQGFVPRQ